MRTVAEKRARILEEATPPRDSGIVGQPRSGVQSVTRSRPPEGAVSTLKQTAAMVDRLRRIAIGSERPPAMPVQASLAGGGSGGSSLVDETTTRDLDGDSQGIELIDVQAPMEHSDSLRLIVPNPLTPLSTATGPLAMPAGQSMDGVRTTNRLPPARRAARRAAARSLAARVVGATLVLVIAACGGAAIQVWVSTHGFHARTTSGNP
jgi:hypothetical protein